ncbi:MAG: S41 family peptidase [Cytophagales bacterium]|nr:MAG: S41 family peptidase [Cytophagales bacterium]TAF62168.1 MAG: S41 family peptidase [Cytophagales bacterium]
MPLITCLALGVGMLIGGKMFSTATTPERQQDLGQTLEKLKQVMLYVEHYYVDTANIEELADYGIEQMLLKLDPHTVYIPLKDLQISNAQLEGDFDGIGVEFNIFKDTLSIMAVIPNGPSEMVGLQAGDKVIMIDDKNVAGVKLTSRDVFSKLRGPRGTKVKVSVRRKGQSKLMDFIITRDQIPTYTVDAAYMIDKKTGFLKVSRFGERTYEEYKEALAKLTNSGMKRLILDLRGNPGGYMDRAIDMVDELLAGKKKIVYTDGKVSQFDEVYYSSKSGTFEKGEVIVLIDEFSASASEIVSGAIQDNDRGLVLGRRSFGKGLVQKPIQLIDGSQLRLTISRYYIPSGRCIQKPYDKNKDYEMDLVDRYNNGEFYHLDSIKLDKTIVYKTAAGRPVYGGGGVMPDVFVPRDTSHFSPFLTAVYFSSTIIREFAIDYVNANRKNLQAMGLEAFATNFKMAGEVENTFLAKVKEANIKYKEADYKISRNFILNELKGAIARAVWQNEGYYRITNELDREVQEALKNFELASKIQKDS